MTTRQEIEAAPLFTVFRPEPLPEGADLNGEAGDWWDVFECDGYDMRVAAMLTGMGLPAFRTDGGTLLAVQVNDGEEPTPETDDIDAAVAAIAAGHTLIKIPDSTEGKAWRIYSLDHLDANGPASPYRSHDDALRGPARAIMTDAVAMQAISRLKALGYNADVVADMMRAMEILDALGFREGTVWKRIVDALERLRVMCKDSDLATDDGVRRMLAVLRDPETRSEIRDQAILLAIGDRFPGGTIYGALTDAGVPGSLDLGNRIAIAIRKLSRADLTPDEADVADLARILEPRLHLTTLCQLLDACGISSRPHNRDCADRIVRALERLSELHAAGLDREPHPAEVERDEARRQLIDGTAAEWSGTYLTLAAQRWGKSAALALYPDELLRDRWAYRRHGFERFADMTDADDRADIEAEVLREHEALDVLAGVPS